MNNKTTRYTEIGDYMPIEGANIINVLTHIIDFYRRERRRLKSILLQPMNWNKFVDELRKIDPTYEVNHQEGVQFDGCDVTIKRGSNFQVKEIQYEFYTNEELIKIMQPETAEC